MRQNFDRRDFLKLTGLSAAALYLDPLVQACSGSSTQPSTPQAVSKLRLAGSPGLYGYPSPFAMTRGPGFLGMAYLFDQLVWDDYNGTRPWLAESFNLNSNTLTATFKLRPNLKFQDGTPLTADDVAFSVQYINAHPMPWTINTGLIDHVATPDPGTVLIMLKQPSATFLISDMASMPIIPKAIWSQVSDPYKFRDPKALVGSGPYTLKQFDAVQGTYQYVANDAHFLGKPVVREIDYVAVGDPLLALLKSDIDAASPNTAQGIGADALQPFKADSKFGILEGVGDNMTALYFNFDQGAPFNDRSFRQAVAYGINRKDLVDRVLQGSGTPGNPGWLAPGGPWYNPNVASYAFNLDQAKTMLDQAGYSVGSDGIRQTPTGKPLSFTMVYNTQQQRTAEVLQSDLQALGIDVKLQGLDFGALRSTATQGKYQLALLGSGGLSGDPDFNFEAFNSKAPAGQQFFNRGHGYSNPQFDQLQLQQRATLDPVKRKAVVGQMQQIFATDVPALSLYYLPRIYIYNKQVFGSWYFTPGGIAGGQPSAENKEVFVTGTR